MNLSIEDKILDMILKKLVEVNHVEENLLLDEIKKEYTDLFYNRKGLTANEIIKARNSICKELGIKNIFKEFSFKKKKEREKIQEQAQKMLIDLNSKVVYKKFLYKNKCKFNTQDREIFSITSGFCDTPEELERIINNFNNINNPDSKQYIQAWLTKKVKETIDVVKDFRFEKTEQEMLNFSNKYYTRMVALTEFGPGQLKKYIDKLGVDLPKELLDKYEKVSSDAVAMAFTCTTKLGDMANPLYSQINIDEFNLTTDLLSSGSGNGIGDNTSRVTAQLDDKEYKEYINNDCIEIPSDTKSISANTQSRTYNSNIAISNRLDDLCTLYYKIDCIADKYDNLNLEIEEDRDKYIELLKGDLGLQEIKQSDNLKELRDRAVAKIKKEYTKVFNRNLKVINDGYDSLTKEELKEQLKEDLGLEEIKDTDDLEKLKVAALKKKNYTAIGNIEPHLDSMLEEFGDLNDFEYKIEGKTLSKEDLALNLILGKQVQLIKNNIGKDGVNKQEFVTILEMGKGGTNQFINHGTPKKFKMLDFAKEINDDKKKVSANGIDITESSKIQSIDLNNKDEVRDGLQEMYDTLKKGSRFYISSQGDYGQLMNNIKDALNSDLTNRNTLNNKINEIKESANKYLMGRLGKKDKSKLAIQREQAVLKVVRSFDNKFMEELKEIDNIENKLKDQVKHKDFIKVKDAFSKDSKLIEDEGKLIDIDNKEFEEKPVDKTEEKIKVTTNLHLEKIDESELEPQSKEF